MKKELCFNNCGSCLHSEKDANGNIFCSKYKNFDNMPEIILVDNKAYCMEYTEKEKELFCVSRDGGMLNIIFKAPGKRLYSILQITESEFLNYYKSIGRFYIVLENITKELIQGFLDDPRNDTIGTSCGDFTSLKAVYKYIDN